MLNALINYKHFAGNLVRFFQKLRLMVAYVLINQRIGKLFTSSSQNKILMVDRGAFLVSKRTNLYVGVRSENRSVVVQVMRNKQAADQVMQRFFFGRTQKTGLAQ